MGCGVLGKSCISGLIFGRPEADKTFAPSGTLYDFDGNRTRLLVSSDLRRHRLSAGDSTSCR